MNIVLDQVRKSFRRGSREIEVLRGISCEFPAGSFNFIVGPSGSGKSSLMYLLGALDKPTAGKITIDGQEMSGWTEQIANEFRSRRVGFVFQNFNLMSNLTAVDNVLVPFLPRGARHALRQQAEQMLERVGLGDRLLHKPGELSGGEQQRVAIARALLKQPDLILADEPTGELDSQTGQEVFQYLRELATANQATVIVVTHDASYMQPEDAVHRIRDGQLVETITGKPN
ncbi:MAG: ABC transporter ATP-binding protein [Planctomycetaceae bacterium]|nr:ABC transporter ATP-binding protein [Planctomycetaceae bacterium]